jgi:hypothetical protein
VDTFLSAPLGRRVQKVLYAKRKSVFKVMDSEAAYQQCFLIISILLGESVTLKMNQIRFSDAVVFTHLISKQKVVKFMNCYNF